LENAYLNAAHFNLAHNEDAISYFEADGYNIDSLIPLVKDELYKLNEVKGQHPIVPYGSSEGRKMMINTVKMLNHKWIIADFSDGEFWGEVFLTYQINNNHTVTFTLVESFLYPFD
ncbi:hydrolase, partial [Seonamhaeicola marinus]